jgi:predicted RNA-binding Zn-ribbon protein involved in translation (DUF1610 family)
VNDDDVVVSCGNRYPTAAEDLKSGEGGKEVNEFDSIEYFNSITTVSMEGEMHDRVVAEEDYDTVADHYDDSDDDYSLSDDGRSGVTSRSMSTGHEEGAFSYRRQRRDDSMPVHDDKSLSLSLVASTAAGLMAMLPLPQPLPLSLSQQSLPNPQNDVAMALTCPRDNDEDNADEVAQCRRRTSRQSTIHRGFTTSVSDNEVVSPSALRPLPIANTGGDGGRLYSKWQSSDRPLLFPTIDSDDNDQEVDDDDNCDKVVDKELLPPSASSITPTSSSPSMSSPGESVSSTSTSSSRNQISFSAMPPDVTTGMNFTCPKCGRTFRGSWAACQQHTTSRKHAARY